MYIIFKLHLYTWNLECIYLYLNCIMPVAYVYIMQLEPIFRFASKRRSIFRSKQLSFGFPASILKMVFDGSVEKYQQVKLVHETPIFRVNMKIMFATTLFHVVRRTR